MAEGGGTVGFLSRPNTHGVSVHFVIERSGRIVQMLNLSHMHTSIRITQPGGAHAIRHTDDEDGVYGQTAAVGVMGAWADVHASSGPNHASIAVECEGFAAEGPNSDQAAALGRLWADLKTRYPGIRSLGHRDFNSYKACPGKKVPWNLIGGHGTVSAGDDDMPGLKVTLIGDKAISGVFRTTIDTEAINLHDRSIRDPIAAGRPFQALGTYARDYDAAPGYVLTESRIPSWVSETAGTFTPDAFGPVASQSYAVTVGGKPVGEVVLP
jgi:hypothetical protein